MDRPSVVRPLSSRYFPQQILGMESSLAPGADRSRSLVTAVMSIHGRHEK